MSGIPESTLETTLRPRITQSERFYTIGGERYNRVTAVLGTIDKPWMFSYATRLTTAAWLAELERHGPEVLGEGGLIDHMASEVEAAIKTGRNAAKEAGTRAHLEIQRLSRNGFPGLEDVPPDILPAVQSAQAFMRSWGLVPVAVERTVWSSVNRVAGTIDMVARGEDGTVYLVDWKRAKGLYPEHAYQLAAYADMFTTQVQRGIAEGSPNLEGSQHFHAPAFAAPRLLAVRLPQEPPGGSYEVRAVELLPALTVYQATLQIYRTKQAQERLVWKEAGCS